MTRKVAIKSGFYYYEERSAYMPLTPRTEELLEKWREDGKGACLALPPEA
jgi:hypothetical protein